MKCGRFGGLAIVILAASRAFAADPPLRPTYKAPLYKAPVLQAPTWTGFYVGANAGYGFGNQSVNATGDSATGGQAAINAGAIPATLASRPSGFVGGGQIGFNYQINQIVLGIEADGQGADIRDHQTVTTNVAALNFLQFTTDAQQKVDFFGTVRGRVGFTPISPLLVYATGGLAYGDVAISGSVTNPGCVGFCGSTSSSSLQTGWTAGGGFEYAFTPNWSGKVEYLYYDLGTLSQRIIDPRFAGAFIDQTVAFKGNIVRAGVNYKFNWYDADY
jgi:outer membrane immunogenic protein